MRIPQWLALTAVLAAVPVLAAPPSEAGKDKTPFPDPSDFVEEIDNPFFPLEPGTTFFYEGEREGVPASDTFHVTHRTKTILGVRCVVVHDDAFEEGRLVERTSDYFAQDSRGNVWYFGEDTEELDENGNVASTEGTWRAGVDGALPGIIMEAHPRVGDSYDQEVAPGVAEDKAKVLRLDGETCVPFGCFDDLLVTKEWSPLSPGEVENKYYAAGIGFVFGTLVKGGDEVTRLVSIDSSGPD